MKKKKTMIMLLNLLPFSLPASNGAATEAFATVSEFVQSFKAVVTKRVGGALGYMGARLSEVGARLADFFSRLGEMNKEAIHFLRTTGVEFFKCYPAETLGALCLLVGVVVFINGLVYKPRYKLAGVPANAIPLKKKIPPSVVPEAPKVEERRPQAAGGDYVVNPLNVPHVESSEAEEFELQARVEARKADAAYYDSHADDAGLDKEDLDFFRSLANDFDKIDSDLDK